jgi:hypothetical protein
VNTKTLIAISGPRPKESLEPVSADLFAFFFGTSFLIKKFIEIDIPDACETKYKLDGIRTCDQIARALVRYSEL